MNNTSSLLRLLVAAGIDVSIHPSIPTFCYVTFCILSGMVVCYGIWLVDEYRLDRRFERLTKKGN